MSYFGIEHLGIWKAVIELGIGIQVYQMFRGQIFSSPFLCRIIMINRFTIDSAKTQQAWELASAVDYREGTPNLVLGQDN